MNPRRLIITLGTLTFAAAIAVSAPAPETNDDAATMKALLARYQWSVGPTVAKMRDLAEVKVPAGFIFTDEKGTQDLLRSMGNPTSGDELGFLAPTNFDWFVVYEFDEVGFVKDDEKDKLDADAMLKAMRKGNEIGNKEREKMGAAPLKLIGWHTKPKYNPETHNLEWAINLESEGDLTVNYNTRVLGRKGVMEVTLVSDSDQLNAILPEFEQCLANYSFQSGQKYAEYRQGDRIAKYGLTALIVGGAAAGAAKLGLFAWIAVMFKKLWKLIVVALVAVGGFLKKLFGGRGATAE